MENGEDIADLERDKYLGRLRDDGGKPKRTFWVAGFSSEHLGAAFSDPKVEGKLSGSSEGWYNKHFVIVLGKQLAERGLISSELKGRVLRGLQLNETLTSTAGGPVVKVVFSGGKGECGAMIDFASQFIDEDTVKGIICEDTSNTTVENMECALELVEKECDGVIGDNILIWIVSSSYHLRRAVRVMRMELGRRGGRAGVVGYGDFFAIPESCEEHEYNHRHNNGGVGDNR